MKKFVAPLIWSIIGTILVLWSISSSGPLYAFWDSSSVTITLFGSMSAVFISFPFEEIKLVPGVLKELLFEAEDSRVEMVQTFVELSRKSRVNGILSIEDDIQELDNQMMANGIQMIVDGKDAEAIKKQLTLEIDFVEQNYEVAPLFLSKWGEFAPAFGMIGTLIGLIVMLGELDDPSMIGTGMAVALLTTFYGSFLSNLVFLPLATNVQQLIAEKMITYDIILEGILAMQEGQNPRDLEERLKVYLNAAEQLEMDTSESVAIGNFEKQEG